MGSDDEKGRYDNSQGRGRCKDGAVVAEYVGQLNVGKGGLTAADACCNCGGGTNASAGNFANETDSDSDNFAPPSPPPSPPPPPPTYASAEAKCLERKDQGFSWEYRDDEWKCVDLKQDAKDKDCTDDPDGYLGNTTCGSLLLHPEILGNCSTDMGVVINAAAGYEVWMYCQKTCKACDQEVDWGGRR